MVWLRVAIVALTAMTAGWMAFDGGRALLVGDYVTPRSGPYAGQLGPWRHAAAAVGIEPRSTLMKSIFLAYGVVWLCVVVAFALGAPWGWWAMLALAVCSLWYMAVGTLCSLVVIGLLVWARVKATA